MSKHKYINNVAVLGIVGNIVLLIAKLFIGFISGSQAMIADGLNSAGDVFASVMTLIGNKISSRPGDADHPYGHGKAEYIFSMIISFSLILVAFSIFRSAFDSLINKTTFQFSIFLIIVVIGNIVIKLYLYFYAVRIGRKYNSLLAMANAEDHRNDVFISSMTLLSIILGYFNIYVIDGIVGLLIALWIAYTGFKIFTSAYNVLMDTNIDDSIKKDMENAIVAIKGIDHIDVITSQPVGLDFLLIVKVSIDANLTVYEGHQISDKIKAALMSFSNIDDVVVHVNPAQYHPHCSLK